MTSKRSGGARWAQLRNRVLATPEGAQAYGEGWLKANDYRDTLRVLDRAREALGVSQSELARRLERRQPTVNRMLRKGTDHSLSTVDAFLRGLGLTGTLKIEKAARKTMPGLQVSARIRRRQTPAVRPRRVAAKRKKSAA
jgi:transcriptional regulator with XRE-family HTH domain